jgi:hypothetical protein
MDGVRGAAACDFVSRHDATSATNIALYFCYTLKSVRHGEVSGNNLRLVFILDWLGSLFGYATTQSPEDQQVCNE